jgi:hypothetical protein
MSLWYHFDIRGITIKDHSEIHNIRRDNSRIRDVLQTLLLYVPDYSNLLQGSAAFPHFTRFCTVKDKQYVWHTFQSLFSLEKNFISVRNKGLHSLCIRATHFAHMKYKKSTNPFLFYALYSNQTLQHASQPNGYDVF